MTKLQELLANAKAQKGTMPKINPPEAAKVLETKTAVEVEGGTPEELPPAVVPAPVEKPADVAAAEAAPKPRRTAAVVQKELDEALERIAELETGGSSVDGALAAQLKTAEEALATKDRELADAAQALKDEEAAHAETIEKVEALTELNEQAAVMIDGMQGGSGRVDTGADTLDLVAELNARGLSVTFPGKVS